MRRGGRPAPAAVLGVLMLAFSWTGQNPPPQSPSFRAGVDLLTVEVRVLDRQARPVLGLRPEDFQVELDGQRRPVQAIEVVAFGASRVSAPVPPPRFQMVPSEHVGRSVLFAFDDLSFQQLRAKSILEDVGGWISSLDPVDRIAVAATSGIAPALTWSTNRDETTRALRSLVGRRDRTLPASVRVVVTIEEARVLRGCIIKIMGTDFELENCSDRATEIIDRECGEGEDPVRCALAVDMEASRIRTDADREAALQIGGLFDILRELGRAPGPRVLVFVSRGVPLENPIELGAVARSAALAGVSVFVLTPAASTADAEVPSKLSPLGLMPEVAKRQDDQLSLLGIEAVAGATNGRSHVVVGSAVPFLDRMLAEASLYYRLGVEAPSGGGDWMSLKVTTRRGGTSVHTASRIARPGVAAEPAPPASLEERLAAMVRRGGLVRGLPVELATSISRDPLGQRLQVTANVRLREARPTPLQALFVVIAEDGRIVSNGQFTLVPRQVAPGSRAAFHVPVPPGRYLLRLGVTDATGEMGLAEQEIVARLTRIGSYYASDVILAWVGRDNQLQYPELDEVPATAVALQASIELYAAEGRPAIVPRVRLSFEPSMGGAAVVRTLEVSVGGTVARARVEVPRPALPPGDYTVRATVFEGEQESGVLTTTLRMAAPAPGP